MTRRVRTLPADRSWLVVALFAVLYVLVFAPARAVVGDVVGALSSIPILVAGSRLSRRKVWGVALAMVLVNGVMFAVTQQSKPTEEWQGAVLGSVALLVTADLIGRVRDNELRVKRTGESKDRFLAGVSHELRTPLTAVIGYASILKPPGPISSRAKGRICSDCSSDRRARWPTSLRTSWSPPDWTSTR